MSRPSSDRLRNAELAVLGVGAFAAALLLAWNAGAPLFDAGSRAQSSLATGMYALKLVMLEAALLAPYVVIALLSRSLLRETNRRAFRIAGLAISLLAAAGGSAMLASSMVDVHLDAGMHNLMSEAVPALVLLTVCAVFYAGLVWLARHAELEDFSRSKG